MEVARRGGVPKAAGNGCPQPAAGNQINPRRPSLTSMRTAAEGLLEVQEKKVPSQARKGCVCI